MAAGLSDFVRHLRGAVRGDRLAVATDAELLTHFATDRDDLAFAELVHRHAPAVYAQCRRHLSATDGLDDAFQATFVVLARKAGTLAHPERLCSWLCGVADRIARKARVRNARRSTAERPLNTADEPTTTDPTSDAELRAVLDQELNALPPDLRQLVLLCDVEGLSRRAVAKRLGIPVGTLSNRLTRARAILGSRLLRRGIALGAGLTLTTVTIASVPSNLISLTVSRITTDTVPLELLTLASEGTLPVIQYKTATILLIGIVLAAVALVPLSAREPVKARQPVRAKKPADPPEPADPTPIDGGMAYSAAYSGDGKLLAFAEAKGFNGKGEHRVTVFDATTWKVLHHLSGPTDTCRGLAFTEDGKTVFAACDDGVVYSWDTKTGKDGVKLEAKAGPCGAVVVSPDGKLLATAHHDYKDKKTKPKIQLWDAATGKAGHSLENDETLFSETLAFSPDGKTVAGAYSAGLTATDKFHGVIEWDVATGKEVKRIDAPRITDGASPVLMKVAFTTDGKQLVVAGGEAVPAGGGCSCIGYLWVLDRKGGKVDKTLIENARSDYIRQMVLSADGKKLFAGTIVPRPMLQNGKQVVMYMAEVKCWDTVAWDVEWSNVAEIGHQAWAFAAAPNGKRVGVSHTLGVDLLDAATGEKKGGLVKVTR